MYGAIINQLPFVVSVEAVDVMQITKITAAICESIFFWAFFLTT